MLLRWQGNHYTEGIDEIMDETTPYYGHWLKEFTFDNCAAGRKEYGEFLASFLAGEIDGFVLNLNGKWGTGKTEFLRRLYTLFCKKNHPVLYIDAWESDFTDDPLLVVASELLNQIKAFLAVDGSDLDKIKKLVAKLIKGTAIVAGSLAGKAVLDDAGAGREFVKQFTDEEGEKLFDAMKNDYSDQVKSVKEIRKELAQLAEALKETHKMNLPVIVLVDELDRCRPSYAIEMLEVIKHFFSTRHFVFVVATDTEQLENSINAVYGEKFNSNMYLRRFFNRKAELAPPDIKTFLAKYKIKYSSNILLYPDKPRGHTSDAITYNLQLIVKAYSLDLRSLDQLIAKLESCLRVIANRSEERLAVNVFALIIAIVEFDNSPDVFNTRAINKPMNKWSENEKHGVDFVIGGERGDTETYFSDYYAFLMNHTVKYVIEDTDNGYNPIRREVFSCHNRDLAIDRNDSAIHLMNIESKITNLVNQSEYKVMLWDDYKGLVRLSHNLS